MALYNKKYNYRNVTLRNLIIAVIDVFDNNLFYINIKDGVEKEETIPFFYSQIGDERLLQDDFLNDSVSDPLNIAAKTNYNKIPIGIISMSSLFLVKNNAVSNKYVRGQYLKEDEEGQLKNFSAELFSIPIQLNMDVEIRVENFLNLCKVSEALVSVFYKDNVINFDVDGNRIPGVVLIPESIDGDIPISYSFTDKREYVIRFPLQVDSYFFSFDKKTERFAGNLMQQGIIHNVIPKERNQ